MVLYGAGYERRDLDELLGLLQDHEVEEVVDVRLTPRSRKRGLSRTRLAAALQDVGIGYCHLPALGNPFENREGFRAGRPDAVARYRARLATDGSSPWPCRHATRRSMWCPWSESARSEGPRHARGRLVDTSWQGHVDQVPGRRPRWSRVRPSPIPSVEDNRRADMAGPARDAG